MRTIKFRIWDGKDMITEGCRERLAIDIENGSILDIEYGGAFDIIKGIPLQYTGLKDKNGKEIYESDLLGEIDNAYADPNVYQVIFHKGKFLLKNLHLDTVITNWDIYTMLGNDFELKGNIYENPELLNNK